MTEGTKLWTLFLGLGLDIRLGFPSEPVLGANQLVVSFFLQGNRRDLKPEIIAAFADSSVYLFANLTSR